MRASVGHCVSALMECFMHLLVCLLAVLRMGLSARFWNCVPWFVILGCLGCVIPVVLA